MGSELFRIKSNTGAEYCAGPVRDTIPLMHDAETDISLSRLMRSQ